MQFLRVDAEEDCATALTFSHEETGVQGIVEYSAGSDSAGLCTAVKIGLWSIVLAAGAGRRLAGVTGGVPKQFWRPSGGTSLLDATLGRVAPLSAPEHTVVIVDLSHREHVLSLSPDRVGVVLFQPSDRGTATGVLLALTPVLDANPDAVVLLTPSDHGVRNEYQFRRGVLEAVRRVRRHDDVVLFGAEPTQANDDYGWIVPGSRRNLTGLRSVRQFVEKPPSSEAERLLALGGVWNTMVVVARASTLRRLFAEHLNELAQVFDVALQMTPPERDDFFSGVYPLLGSWDFSRDVLAPARDLLVYTWPRTIGWSDLGTPERFYGWLRQSAQGHPLNTAGAA